MDGQPVWLASVSVLRHGRRIATGDLTAPEREMVRGLLWELADGIGDESRQRLFRMNVTMCLHRAASSSEVAGLPESFNTSPAIRLAGGPVEVLWETVPGKPSTKPCEHPTRAVVVADRPDLWVPVDCERCEPCRARAEVASYIRPGATMNRENAT
jgi:hypothetical protein